MLEIIENTDNVKIQGQQLNYVKYIDCKNINILNNTYTGEDTHIVYIFKNCKNVTIEGKYFDYIGDQEFSIKDINDIKQQ